MAERKCLMTFYPTKCKDNCFNCECGGAEATKDMYVSIHNVQRVCAITGGAADTDEGVYIAEVIRNNLENMVIPAADVQPVVAHWKRGEEKGFRTYNPLWYCSNCGGQIRYDTRMRQYQKIKRPVWEVNAFCRKCGAKMKQED
ncbi:MAG: hypothetical protein K5979_08275 [Ruminococcus sp.]|nr:hypothetical protein [Ruminococcus sp.]